MLNAFATYESFLNKTTASFGVMCITLIEITFKRTSDTLIGYLPIFSDASQNFPMHKIWLISFWIGRLVY